MGHRVRLRLPLRPLAQTLGFEVANIISDTELTLKDLPEPTDKNAVFEFAMTFDGYKHFGSFEATSANGRAKKRESLTDLRNELFMSARASRHCDNDKFLERYIELLPLFKQMILG